MRALLRVTILSCLLVLSVSPLFAQYALWEPEEGVDLRREHFFDEDYLSITSDSAGHALIVWVDRYRNQVADIHAQLVDTNGHLLWEDGGIYVAGDDISQVMPVVANTGEGEWVIAYVSGYSEEYETEIHAQKVDLNGDLLWGEGIVVCDAPGYQVFPHILADADGDGVVISWEKWGVSLQPTDLALYCQRLDGNGVALWDDNGVAAFQDYTMDDWEMYRRESCLIADGIGGVIVGLDGRRFQRLSENGIGQWGTGMVLDEICSVTSDGCGGLVAIGCNGGNRISHISCDGVRRIDNFPFTPALSSNQIFRGSNSQYYVVFGSNYRDIQAFTLENNSFEPSNEDNIKHLTDPIYQYVKNVCVKQNARGDVTCMYSNAFENAVGTSYDQVYLSFQDVANDTIYGNVDGIPINTERKEKSGLTFCELDSNHIGVVWFCWENEYSTIKSQVFVKSVQADPVAPAELIVAGVQKEASLPTVIKSDKNVYVSWNDQSSRYRYARVQRIDPESGDLLWGERGVRLYNDLIVDGNDTLLVPQLDVIISPDGEGGLYAVSLGSHYNEQDHNYTHKLRLQRCDADGNLLFDEAGIVVGDSTWLHSTYFNFELHPDGGGYILYNKLHRTIMLQRVDENGTLLWGTEGNRGIQLYGDVLWVRSFMHVLEDGSVLCIYGGMDTDPCLYATRISEDGEEMWGGPVIISDDALASENYFDCAVLPGDAIVIAFPNPSDEGDALFMSIVTPDGDLLLGDNGTDVMPLPDLRHIGCNTSTSDVCAAEDGFWIAGATTTQSRLQKFDLNGETITGQIILPQIDTMINNGELTLIPDGSGGVYVLWGGYSQEQFRIRGPIRYGLYWIHVLQDGSYVHQHYDESGNVASLSMARCRSMGIGNIGPGHDCAVSDDEGGFIVTWTSYHDDYSNCTEGISLYAQRFMDDWQEEHVEQIVEQPLEFALESAYPNPFNPLTRIGYTLPSAGHVTLTVYDVLGREVARLLDGPMSAGRHTVVWDTHGSMASSGTYFCRLEKDGQTAIQKLVLVK